jgi:uncharacterized SAM-binding protein YcdF (DUF218 family)
MIFLKILQNLLMPSTFIFIFLGVGFYLLQKNHKRAKLFLFLGIAFYYLFSITPVSNFLLSPLEQKYEPLPTENIGNADKIVLLLGGRESNILRASEVLKIWHLAKTEMKIIISGTDPLISTSEEAQAVRDYFINRGIDAEDIIIEGKSSNTRENVINVQKIVGEKPFFLVTSAYHMYRSEGEFERLKANPIPAPTDFKKSQYSSYNFFDFIPSAQNLRNSDLAIHEHLGGIYYRFIFLFFGK